MGTKAPETISAFRRIELPTFSLARNTSDGIRAMHITRRRRHSNDEEDDAQTGKGEEVEEVEGEEASSL